MLLFGSLLRETQRCSGTKGDSSKYFYLSCTCSQQRQFAEQTLSSTGYLLAHADNLNTLIR